MNFTDISALTALTGLLTLATNVITEVLKKTLPKLPPQLAAFAVSMILTVGSLFAYAAASETEVTWYMTAGAVVGGFFVSYSAQFGFDKLKELIAEFPEK